MQAPDGAPVKAYVDTGGAISIVAPAVADRLKLAPAGRIDADDMQATLAEFPAFLAAAGVPAPLDDAMFHGHLVLAPAPVADSDLFLGGPWLAGRTWEISYLRHELYLAPEWRPSARDHALPMAFRTDEAGLRRPDLPRIVVTVDRQPLDLLLDTGAMAALAPDATPAFHVPPGTVVGASFITQRVFDQWHAAHPDWRVVERGEAIQGHLVPMIEVPRVSVGGFSVGPALVPSRAGLSARDGVDQAGEPLTSRRRRRAAPSGSAGNWWRAWT